MLRRSLLTAAGVLAPAVHAAKPALRKLEIFSAGKDGYHTYRIPSLFQAANGMLLAFCEGRRNSSSDHGDIDLLLKTSADLGRTWSPSRVVANHGEDTIGNPCPVLDRANQRIWLPLTGNPAASTKASMAKNPSSGTRTVWITYSDDHGETWAPTREISQEAKRPGWTWYATGPGIGIQLRGGRLVIPCDHHEGAGYDGEGSDGEGSMVPYSHCLYSDDRGKTWKIGGNVAPHTLECMVVELDDGSLLMNTRQQRWLPERKDYLRQDPNLRRIIARSYDQGQTWTDVREDPALLEPVCQASFIALGKRGRGPAPLLFSNPASTIRENLTLQVSFDRGATWRYKRLLQAGPAGYSSLFQFRNGDVGCLYEQGDKLYHERIMFASFNWRWLIDA